MKILGGIMMAAGILVAGTAGLCALVTLPMLDRGMADLMLVLGTALPPIVIGVLLIVGGRALARRQ